MIRVVDRVPTRPNRYLMTDEDGNEQYVILERADLPSQPGTPLNKALFDSIEEDIENGKYSNTKTVISNDGTSMVETNLDTGIVKTYTIEPSGFPKKSYRTLTLSSGYASVSSTAGQLSITGWRKNIFPNEVWMKGNVSLIDIKQPSYNLPGKSYKDILQIQLSDLGFVAGDTYTLIVQFVNADTTISPAIVNVQQIAPLDMSVKSSCRFDTSGSLSEAFTDTVRAYENYLEIDASGYDTSNKDVTMRFALYKGNDTVFCPRQFDVKIYDANNKVNQSATIYPETVAPVLMNSLDNRTVVVAGTAITITYPTNTVTAISTGVRTTVLNEQGAIAKEIVTAYYADTNTLERTVTLH